MFTHSHTDHVAGFDDLRRYCELADRPMPIYASPHTMADLRRAFYYAFDGQHAFRNYVRPEPHEVTTPFALGSVEIIPAEVPHGKMLVYGYIFACGGRKLAAYFSDCHHVPPAIIKEILGIPMWNPTASIVCSTGLLPIFATNTSPPTSYSVPSKGNFTSSGNSSNLTNIITDFEIPMSETYQYRPTIDYSPSCEYRLVDMRSIINMNMLDITVFWKTHDGEYVPLKLQPGCAAHLKLLFRHSSTMSMTCSI
jgi:hypothetical protein